MGGMHGWGTVAIDPDEPVFPGAVARPGLRHGSHVDGLSGTNLDAFRTAWNACIPTTTWSTATTGAGWRAPRRCWSTAGCSRPERWRREPRNLTGEQVTEPADVEENKPVYERGGAGSLREIDDEPAFSVGTVSGLRTCAPAGTPGCRDTSAAAPAPSTPSALPRCCPTPTPTSRARTPSTCTR